MSIIQHTLGIFSDPDTEWQRIRDEEQTFIKVFFTTVPFLALIPVLCAFYGVTQQGWSIGTGSVVKLTTQSALTLCVFCYLAELVAIFVLGKYVSWMSKSFGVSGDTEKRQYGGGALAVYVSVPMLLAGFILLWPQLWLVASVYIVAAGYSTYLLYAGIPILMNIPKERGFMYASSVLTVALVLAIVVIVATVIVWSAGMGPVYVS